MKKGSSLREKIVKLYGEEFASETYDKIIEGKFEGSLNDRIQALSMIRAAEKC